MNKNSEKVARWRVKVKQKLLAYKGGKCSKCGYDKDCPTAFHFHHRNPENKKIAIGGSTLGFQKLKEEVDKCDLLCSNCHAEIHDDQQKPHRNKLIEKTRTYFDKKYKTCGICGLEFSPKRKEQNMCSRKCVAIKRKSPRTSKI